MTRFERFDSILNNKKPDKMRFYFPAIECLIASEILGKEVNTGGNSLHFKEEASWLDGENAHTEFVHKLHEDLLELNIKLKADIIREGWRKSQRPTKRIDEYTLLFGSEDGPHIVKKFYPDSRTYGIIEDTTALKDIDELKRFILGEIKKDTGVSEEELEILYKDQIDMKRLVDQYFPMILAPKFGGVTISMYSEVWLEAVILDPGMVRDFLLHETEKGIKHIAWIAKKGFKWINAGGDIAGNMGTIYSPDIFKIVNLPPLKKIVEECSKYSIKYCFRSDGNIWSISDYLFKGAGAHAYGEVDRGADMPVLKLRELYPDLIFLGNIQSATLHTGSESDVREETRATLVESGGYNYIPGPSNAIMHGTPVENIYAMISEIEKYRP